MKKGLVHIYYGKGKGKTTAAIGLAVRTAGWGGKVKIIQFLKGRETGEERKLEGKIEKFGGKEFADLKKPTREDFEKAKKGLKAAGKAVKKGFDLVVLDEVGVAVEFGLIEGEKVIELIENRTKKTELVLTGRWMEEKILKKGDYVTEFMERNHPFRKKEKARKGVEY